MRFSDIPFHDDVKQRLRDMVDSNRVPHALMLEGPSGTGKFMLARALAQYLHCTDRHDGEPCGKCPACLQHQGFNHIDTLFSFPVVKKGGTAISADYIDVFCDFMSEWPFMDFERWLSMLDNINAQPQIYVEEGAELLRRLGFTAHGSRYKVVLLWLPERMREETANKLLKLVEEPSDDTKFIMVSNNSRDVLPTIYSRTQRITVRRYDDAELASWLVSTKGIDSGEAANIARLAGGDVNRANALLGISGRGKENLDRFMALMRLAYQRKVADLRAWSNDLAKEGREGVLDFFSYACHMLRENFIYALHVAPLNSMNAGEEAFSSRFSPFVNERNIEELMAVFDAARADIAANANAKIVGFDVAIKVILLLKR